MATMTPAQTAIELQRKRNAGIAPTSSANQQQYGALTAQPSQTAPEQQLAEIRRKASQGITLTNPNATNQATYDAFRANANKEIERKAAAGTPLTDTTNQYNNDLYKSFIERNAANTPTEVAPEVAAPVTETKQNPYDLIRSMYDESYNSQAQKLRALRDQQLSGLAGQDTLINTQAQAGLNANDLASARQATALREQMANRGLGASGDYISAQIGQDTATGQNANVINLDRSQRLEGLAAQRNAITQNASADDLALLQQIMSERSGAQLGQYNTDRDYGLRQQAQEYSQDPNNPSNAGQNIQNQLSQLQLQNYPEEVKQQAALYEQELATGKMTLEAAQYNHQQLIDPNSAYNQSIALDLQMKQLEASSLPEMQKQELLKIKKQISDIGKVHYKPQTQAEKDYDLKQVEKITAEIDKIKASTGETPDTPKPTKNELEAEYYTNLDGMDEAKLKKFFKDEKSNIIADLGKSGYDALKLAYKIYE